MKSAALIILGLALFGTKLTTANPQRLPKCQNPDPAANIYDPTTVHDSWVKKEIVLI